MVNLNQFSSTPSGRTIHYGNGRTVVSIIDRMFFFRGCIHTSGMYIAVVAIYSVVVAVQLFLLPVAESNYIASLTSPLDWTAIMEHRIAAGGKNSRYFPP